MKNGEFLFLGTGGSSGIPMIGCNCAVCLSNEPKNKRLRPSALVRVGDKKLLIDCGPDFRCQALRYHLHQLDGVLLTHTHFDHLAGIDELRVYFVHTKKRMPILLSEPAYLDIRKRYDYLFKEKSVQNSLSAQLDFQILHSEQGSVQFTNIDIAYMRYNQGGMPVTGYRFGSLAYVSDIRNYEESIFENLSEVKILVVSALRKEPARMHFSLDEAVAFAQKVKAERTYITHLGHELEHYTVNSVLPKGVELAYDGLKLEFSYNYGV